MRKRIDGVTRGAWYPVVEVAGREPEELADFVGATTVTLGEGVRAITVVGIGAVDKGVVQFHERELSSAAIDGPIWTIVDQGGDFAAEPRLDNNPDIKPV